MSQEIPTRRVFISYRSQEPDVSLAKAFQRKITGAGHHCFMAMESLRLGDDWPERIGSELEQCDYFLLLLSPASATSDMVTEEVRRAKWLHDTRPDKRPRILRVHVCLPADAPINYDLASHLNRFQSAEWRSEADTERISALILEVIAPGTSFLNAAVPPLPQTVRRNKSGVGLTISLYQSCVRVLRQCREFKDKSTLEPLFGIEPLTKYVNALPLEARSQLHLIELVIHNLVTYPAAKGQPLLDLLIVLRDKRDDEEGERKELDELFKQVSFYLSRE